MIYYIWCYSLEDVRQQIHVKMEVSVKPE